MKAKMQKYEPDPKLPREYRSVDKWTKLEQEVYHDLVQHYNDDCKMIAYQLNRTFGYKVFLPHLIQKNYQWNHQNKELDLKEAKIIYELYMDGVAALEDFIWRKIQKAVPHWKTWILIIKFVHFIKFGFRKLNFFYNKQGNAGIYDLRLQKLQMSGIHMIFYLAQLVPSLVEQEDETFVRFCMASRQLVYLLKYWLDEEIVYIEDPIELFKKCNYKENFIPDIPQDEFQNMMEIILVIDTVVRVLCGGSPYQYKDEEISLFPVIELDYNEVEPRQSQKNWKESQNRILAKLLKKQGKLEEDRFKHTKHKNYLYHKLLWQDTERYAYPQLTYEQMIYITQSKTGNLLIPSWHIKKKVMAKPWFMVRNRYRSGEELQRIKTRKKHAQTPYYL